jgi:hypothetical protein
MSKENSAQNLLKHWQEYMQQVMQNPKNTQVFMENLASFKEFNEKIQSQVLNENAQTNDGNDGNAKLHELELKLDALETRIALLEKLIARNN